MNIRKSAFVLAMATALAAGAHAGETEQTQIMDMELDPTPAFREIDADQNGNITTSEAEGTWLAELFTLVDVNEDGLVDEVEYTEATS